MKRGNAVRAVAVTGLVVASALTGSQQAGAANPVIADRFVADPSAHVFDGRMYLYLTDDETNKAWRLPAERPGARHLAGPGRRAPGAPVADGRRLVDHRPDTAVRAHKTI